MGLLGGTAGIDDYAGPFFCVEGLPCLRQMSLVKTRKSEVAQCKPCTPHPLSKTDLCLFMLQTLLLLLGFQATYLAHLIMTFFWLDGQVATE